METGNSEHVVPARENKCWLPEPPIIDLLGKMSIGSQPDPLIHCIPFDSSVPEETERPHIVVDCIEPEGPYALSHVTVSPDAADSRSPIGSF